MKDYIARMVVEYKELKDRIQKLKKAIDNVEFLAGIGERKAGLLIAQYHAMKTYGLILASRLAIEVEEGNCTAEDISG